MRSARERERFATRSLFSNSKHSLLEIDDVQTTYGSSFVVRLFEELKGRARKRKRDAAEMRKRDVCVKKINGISERENARG